MKNYNGGLNYGQKSSKRDDAYSASFCRRKGD